MNTSLSQNHFITQKAIAESLHKKLNAMREGDPLKHWNDLRLLERVIAYNSKILAKGPQASAENPTISDAFEGVIQSIKKRHSI